MAFLTTRVKLPDIDDWKKLVRLVHYLHSMVDLVLTLSADEKIVNKWWVHGLFAVHPNMRGHSGGCMSLGAGVIAPGSHKQKLNVRSSTESELVAVDVYLVDEQFLACPGHGGAEQDFLPRQPELNFVGQEWLCETHETP